MIHEHVGHRVVLSRHVESTVVAHRQHSVADRVADAVDLGGGGRPSFDRHFGNVAVKCRESVVGKNNRKEWIHVIRCHEQDILRWVQECREEHGFPLDSRQPHPNMKKSQIQRARNRAPTNQDILTRA